MKAISLLLILSILCPIVTHAQSDNPWSPKSEQFFAAEKHQRRIIPNNYKTHHLNFSQIKSILSEAPLWQTDESNNKTVTLSLPMPDGTFQSFSIVEAPVMHPDLAKKYPSIKTYAGYGLDDPTAYLRFDLTPQGFHAMILTGNGSDIFIDPYSTADLEHYITYYKSEAGKTSDWQCGTEHNSKPEELPTTNSLEKAGDCKLRTYSLALACTGEYATYHGGTVTTALAAMNTTMARVNGVFEKDLSVTLQLVANNDLLVFTNATTDPYSNTNGSAMLAENQTKCDAVIGNANYDIGHVFSTGGGGVAYVKAVCNVAVKAGGVTGSSAPIGDNFDIDYVCHEMGHQFGANHTQNNNCNRNAATAVETGSGSTIMSYAGVCAPNVQAHSDAYFHSVSLGEIAAHVTGTGNACATSTIINNAPTAAAGLDYVVPKSTAFVLTGTGTDPDPGTSLTYCWEQMDNQVSTQAPVAGNTAGPSFRSYAPVASPLRYFPNLTAIIAGTTPTWEVLPSVGRTMNFRLTVRDNKPGGGCTKEDNMIVTVDGVSGPFLVTAPNTAVSFAGGSTQTVNWNVAGTTAAPVSAANVDILLSTDGGLTYPVTLAAATPNDGTQAVTIPNTASTTARIMVKGSGNIFFDISNANFTITAGANPPVSVTLTSQNVGCFGSSNGSITANATGGNGTYTYAWSTGGTIQYIANLAVGTYSVTVTSDGNSSTASATITQPTAVSLAVSGVNPSSGNNGTATAAATGGTSPYAYAWSNGGTTATISGLGAGTYTATVTDSKGCTKTGSVTLTAVAPPPASGLKFEYGTLTSVNNQWQTVTLQNSYASMVVVASLVYPNNTGASLVTRIQNASGNSFQVKAQDASSAIGAAGPVKVYWMVAEEGTYTVAAHGVKFEAKKFTSTATSKSTLWAFEARTYGQTYTVPVVLGQVMSYNDPNWSVFWASQNGTRTNPPSATSFSASKHIAEDNVFTTRANETIGYMVFEKGTGFINGKKFNTAVGTDIVKGEDNGATGFNYALTGFATVEAAIVSTAALDGSEGSWAVLATATPLTTTVLKTWTSEDKIMDAERSHTTEQNAYIVFGTGTPVAPGDLTENRPEGAENANPAVPAASYLVAYPNPARSQTIVEFNQTEDFDSPKVLLTDLFGKILREETLTSAEAGVRQTTMDVSELQPGCYFVHVLQRNQARTVKLIRAQE